MKMDDPVAYTPAAIERLGDTGIRIKWSDGEETHGPPDSFVTPVRVPRVEKNEANLKTRATSQNRNRK